MTNNSTAASNVIPFDFRGHSVRAITVEGEPWFVAADISNLLEYRDSFNMCRTMDAEEKGTHSVSTLGGNQKMLTISESGLYVAILRSKKKEARIFRKWVTSEVLPAIRKAGRYEEPLGKMATLIGQTIGTDGFHMLGALVKGKVSRLPKSCQRRATSKIWSQTHAAFGVRSAADIPSDQLDSARNFIAACVVLEGEYLAKSDGFPANGSPNTRYLVSFDHRGERKVSEIPSGAYVLSQEEFLKGIAHVPGDIPISTDGLFEFAIAAMNNLRLRSQFQNKDRAA